MLHMKHTDTNQEMWLMFNCWFKPNEEKCIELPTFCGDQDPLPGKMNKLSLQTIETLDASASLMLSVMQNFQDKDSDKL